MKRSDIQSISNIPGLEQIADAAAKFDITFTLFGSTVRRLLEQLNGNRNPNIFTLCTHSSDFDIFYTKKSVDKGELIDFLAKSIPYFECFRWQIFSFDEFQKYQIAAAYNNHIPANLITLSSDPLIGFVDFFNGEADIQQSQYQFIRNPLFKKSNLLNAKRDLELFSALIYLGILAEVNASDVYEQPGFKAVSKILEEAASKKNRIGIVNVLQESNHLRTRFRYLLKSIAAKSQGLANTYHICRSAGLIDLLQKLDSDSQDSSRFSLQFHFSKEIDLSEGHVQIISSLISGDRFRLPHFQVKWERNRRAAKIFFDEMTSSVGSPDVSLIAGQEVFLASESILIASGIAPCGNLSQLVPQELVYFKVFEDFRTCGAADEDISALIILKAGLKSHFLPLPCIAEIMPQPGYLCLRISIGSTFNLASQYLGSQPLEMRIFVVRLLPTKDLFQA